MLQFILEFTSFCSTVILILRVWVTTISSGTTKFATVQQTVSTRAAFPRVQWGARTLKPGSWASVSDHFLCANDQSLSRRSNIWMEHRKMRKSTEQVYVLHWYQGRYSQHWVQQRQNGKATAKHSRRGVGPTKRTSSYVTTLPVLSCYLLLATPAQSTKKKQTSLRLVRVWTKYRYRWGCCRQGRS